MHPKNQNKYQPRTKRTPVGFTIVELLIVIVVIGILAAITIVAYNGVQARAQLAKRESDVATYYKAIVMAREGSDKVLRYVTLSTWSIGFCAASSGNPGNLPPKDLPKTHACWTQYYSNLDRIGAAAGVNLSSLRGGDANGNPYMLDENEGEQCTTDRLYYFTGNGAAYSQVKDIERYLASSC